MSVPANPTVTGAPGPGAPPAAATRWEAPLNVLREDVQMGGVAIVVFTDLVDSTALLARLGDDRMEGVRREHVADVTGAVDAAGGRLVKTLGDGTMASFESALGALRAAAAIQAAVERLNTAHGEIGIAARVGIAAGEPIADGEDLHGMSVVIASRLSSAAGTGEVLVQDVVEALVASRDGMALEDGGEYELKGVPAPVRASRLLWRELALPVEVEEGGRAGFAADSSAAPSPAAGAVGTVDRVRMPPILAAYAEEPLIGRDAEISSLRGAIAPRPGRRAALIVGEPGIGKTRHAAAAAAAAHAEGAVVVLARCPPEPTIAFEPWVRAIDELAIAGDESWRATLAEAAGPELAALVPELSEHATSADRAGADAVVAAEGARYRLLRGIGTALARAAGSAPLVVVLDDAHWCDPASAQALERLLESAPSAEMALVVTARDREMGRRHPVSRALADLRRTGDLSELRLSGLDASGLAALVGAKMGRAITPRLAERLQARTGGNPFFAGELARDLDGQGALRDDEDLDAAPVPDAVTDLVEERLGRLDPDTERLLCAVAAIGPSAPVGLAARAIGLEPAAAERAAREAISERLVDDVVATEPTIAFPHALVREALIAGTGEVELARMHYSIAQALEDDPGVEPAELARHYGLSVGLAGPEPAIAAYRAAAAAAAEGHDHEQAAAHMQSVLSLLPEGDLATRGRVLLELGEQELLSADLVRARRSFGAAIEAARATGDAVTLARAALGFAGGDIGFGWESGTDDPMSAAQLREGLDALGDEEPRLALGMLFRLVYLSVYSVDDGELEAIARRAEQLGRRLDDPEARLLSRFTVLTTGFARHPDPLRVFDDLFEPLLGMIDLAEECGREDLLFRVVLWSAVVYFSLGRLPECEQALEQAGEIARRLGSPRFAWEMDLAAGMRLMDRGDREGGVALVRRAGSIVRRLRPDIHVTVELIGLMIAEWIYDGETATSRVAFEAMETVMPRGFTGAVSAFIAAADGDLATGRERMWALLGDDLEPLRRPDGHVPATICFLALTAALVGDGEAGARLRPLLEPLRPYLIQAPPSISFGHIAEWHIGCLELLAGNPDAAVEELRSAVSRADAFESVWLQAWARVDLARALHRQGASSEAEETLAEGEAIAAEKGIGWGGKRAAAARAEIEGRAPQAPRHAGERSRPLRALTSRGGRRALGALARGLDDAELERRFADPRRQRALLKALARSFQPAQAGGFGGVVAYELEPLAIEPAADSPWRWAIEVDSAGGRARLLEPAPLDAAVTVHLGLADWVRVVAGTQSALTAMVAGRCSVEGDLTVAVRLEAMFGG
jgi:class 3 adenylate cyclase/tetratricopeptide (TPR) repeat protein